MIPLDEVIALLHRLKTLGWPMQMVGLFAPLAGYALLLLIAWRSGRGNIADLEDENAALETQVAESNAKRRTLRDEESKLKSAIRSLKAQRPEERLACAAQEREHGNEERAIQIHQEILATFGPDLARCCKALAAGVDGPEIERYRTLAVRLAGIGAQR